MSRWPVLILLACLGCSAPSLQEGSLFDGRSLEGWEGDTEKTWRVQDGAIVGGSMQGNPRNEFLTTKRSYSDFVLRFEYKLVGTEGFVNGGVQVRSRRISNPPNEMSGYQADIGAGMSGSLYDESRRKRMLAKADPELLKTLEKPGDWNRYEVRCEGPRIRLLLNGTQTVDYTETQAEIERDGLIGLQIHGNCKAEIFFRNIVVEELPRGHSAARPNLLVAFVLSAPAPLGEGPEAAITIPGTKVQFTLRRFATVKWMGSQPVTWREYDSFFYPAIPRRGDGVTRPTDAKGYLATFIPPSALAPEGPAVAMRWHGAVAYCDWLSKVTGRRFRLPTEAEWEQAGHVREDLWEYCLEPDRPGEYAPVLRSRIGEGRTSVMPRWYELDPCRPRSTWWLVGGWHQAFRVVCVEGREDRRVREAYLADIGVSITGFEELPFKARPALGGPMVRVRGEIVNRGDRTVDELDLTVYYLDPGGWPHLVEAQESDQPGAATFGRCSPVMTALGRGPESLPLKPGEKRPWQVEFPQSFDSEEDVDLTKFGARVEALILVPKP